MVTVQSNYVMPLSIQETSAWRRDDGAVDPRSEGADGAREAAPPDEAYIQWCDLGARA